MLDNWDIRLLLHKLPDNYHTMCSSHLGPAMDIHCLLSPGFDELPYGYLLERFEQKQPGREEKINDNSFYMYSAVSIPTYLQAILFLEC